MAATSATFLDLPRRHKWVSKSRMVGLWRVIVTVVVQGIVRTEAQPSQTRRWPRYQPMPGQEGNADPRGHFASVETVQLLQPIVATRQPHGRAPTTRSRHPI